MKNIVFISFLIVFISKSSCMSHPPAVNEDLKTVVRLIADGYKHSYTGDASEFYIDLSARIESEAAKLPIEFQASLGYHRAIFLASIGKSELAKKIVDSSIYARYISPEIYWLAILLYSENNEVRWGLEDKMGKLLPLSVWGKLRDGKLQDKEATRLGAAITDDTRQGIPNLSTKKLLEIAQLFNDMKMYKEASIGNFEAIYSGPPPRIEAKSAESWTGIDNRNNWLSLAQSLHFEGKYGASFHAILMAVACDPGAVDTAIQILQQPENIYINEEITMDKVTKIANLYKEMLLHPRALDVLETAGKMLHQDVSIQSNVIKKEWSTIIREYCQGREDFCFVFGHLVKNQSAYDLNPKSNVAE